MAAPFITKLWECLHDRSISDVVAWGDADAVVVLDEAAFKLRVLPRLCKSQVFPSFVRQEGRRCGV